MFHKRRENWTEGGANTLEENIPCRERSKYGTGKEGKMKKFLDSHHGLNYYLISFVR